MGALRDLAGVRFGRLVALRRDGVENDGAVRWACVCDCGVEKTIKGASLTQGLTSSCGCLHKERARETSMRHGHLVGDKQSPLYITWRAMLRRCENKNHVDYHFYGGQGVKVCDAWHSFPAFMVDVGERPEGSSLDRYPNGSGNYEPGNVRWATPTEQARNTKSNRLLTLNGITKCTAEWCDELGLNQNTVRGRLFSGWSDKRALMTLVRHK